MKHLARFALLAFSLAVLTNTPPARVDAAPCPAMNVFVTGTTANPTPVNQNFANLVACAEDIDNSNIGSAGIFASQIIPTSSTQATFGGSQNYTFPVGLTVGGALSAASSSVAGTASATNETVSGNVTTGSLTASSANVSGTLAANAMTSGGGGYVAPTYFFNGTTTPGFHIVAGNITISSPGAGNVNLTGAVTLSGSAVFTTNGTYNVTLTPDLSAGNAPVGWDQYFTSYVVKNSGSEFDVHIYDHGTTTTGASGSGSVDYIAIGY